MAWIVGADGSAVSTNAAFREHTGLSMGEARGLGWFSALHPEDPESAPSHWRRAFERDVMFTAELRLGRAAGGHERCRASVVPLRDGSGGWLVMAEPARAGPPAARAGTWEWFVTSGRVSWSPEAGEILGAEAGPVERTIEDLERHVFPADRARMWSEVARVQYGGHEVDLEFRVQRPDGAVRWVHSLARVERDVTGRVHRFVATIRDTTRERELTTQLEASEAAYRELADVLPQIVWTTAADGRLEWLNEGWVALTGKTIADTLADEWNRACVHPDDLPTLTDRWSEATAAGAAWEAEYRLRRADGVYRWYFARVVPVRDVAGQITRWAGSATDIHDRRCVEDDLRQSQRRWMTLFHLSPLPSAISRRSDGTLIDVNEAFVRQNGRSRDEVIGRTAVDLGYVSASQREEVVESARENARGGGEFVVRTADGRVRTVVVAVASIDLGGEPCLLTVVNDVTDYRAAEQALRASEAHARARADELTAVMDAVPAAIWIARDRQCHDVTGNLASTELLRLPPGANPSKTAVDPSATANFRVFAHGVEVPPDLLPLQRAAREGLEQRGIEEELHFEDGQVVSVYGSAVPLTDEAGAPRGAILALMDVTRLKQAEAALREADRRKDQFLAMLSHELRNPLAPVLTAARMMARRGDVATPLERAVILRQTQHMVRLIDDLLDVSRVVFGKFTLEKRPIEVAQVVARAVEASGPLLDGRRQTLELALAVEGALVEADEVRLTQVFANLLTNAARYTPVGGCIGVSAGRDGDEVVVRVRDDGVGMEPGLIPRVFDPFVQGERRTDGGLGLGLALVKMMTELHGGTVEAHSDGPGRGSEFTVRLPAAAPAAHPHGPLPSAPQVAARGSGRRRVLVVDDNVDAALTLARFLEWSGYTVCAVHDPSAALSALERFEAQLAILDIGLPDMDGYALATAMRARLGDGTPTLVALTGYGQEDDERRSLEAGFALHLVKPVDPDELVALLETLAR